MTVTLVCNHLNCPNHRGLDTARDQRIPCNDSYLPHSPAVFLEVTSQNRPKKHHTTWQFSTLCVWLVHVENKASCIVWAAFPWWILVGDKDIRIPPLFITHTIVLCKELCNNLCFGTFANTVAEAGLLQHHLSNHLQYSSRLATKKYRNTPFKILIHSSWDVPHLKSTHF